jgi:hypothetical protein
MEETNKINLGENLKEYTRLQFEIAKLQVTDKVSESGSQIISHLVVGTFLMVAVLLLSVALGFHLSSLMGSTAKGFGVVGAVYFVFALLMFLLRKTLLILPLRDRIIHHILKEKV